MSGGTPRPWASGGGDLFWGGGGSSRRCWSWSPSARPAEWRGGEEERLSGSPSNEKVAVVLVSFASNINSAEFC